MKPEICAGIVAKSKKGRDKNKLFVVLYEMDADFVMICDGRTHPLAHLKKKRRKHLLPIGAECPQVMSLYAAGRLKDSDVRTALQPIVDAVMNMKEAESFVER